MKRKVKLPYCSHYVPGDALGLDWLTAVTSNDYLSARYLDWHDHDELEIVFPLRGHYRYEFSGGRSTLVDSESFLVIPGGSRHRLDEAIDPPGLRLHFYLKAPSSRPAPRGTFAPREFARIYQMLSSLSLKGVPASAPLKTAIAALAKIVTRDIQEQSDDDRMQGRFLCCLVLCRSVIREETAKDRSPGHMVAEAVRWLENNYATSVRMDQLLAYIGYSRARFFSLFKQQTNMTPSEYLRNYRLEKAKELLAQTDRSAQSIGKDCGLGDPAHFSRLFSKMTGCTPLAYRETRKR